MQRIVGVVAILVIFAVVGVSLVMAAPMDHDMGCPLMLGETVMCATGFEHLFHFKWAFLAITAEILLLFIFIAYVSGFRNSLGIDNRQTVRYRVLERIPKRPTLFQELFSNGILNPKSY